MARDTHGSEQRALMNLSPIGLARAQVIVMRNRALSLPYAGSSEGHIYALAFTDIEAAWNRIGQDADAEPMALTVAQLAGALDPEWGLLIDPDDDPIAIAAADVPAVAAAGAIFPPDVSVTLAPADGSLSTFCAALRPLLGEIDGLIRAWVFRMAVEALAPEALVVVQTTGEDISVEASEIVLDAARRINLPIGARTIRVDEMPSDFAIWARQNEALIEPALP